MKNKASDDLMNADLTDVDAASYAVNTEKLKEANKKLPNWSLEPPAPTDKKSK